MTLLQYETGASNVSLIGLANANFVNMEFDSGAGNYTLDFSGTFQRDASVNIETGVSNMTLVIPTGIPVRITVDGGLSNVTFGSGWRRKGMYTSRKAPASIDYPHRDWGGQSGSHPLTIFPCNPDPVSVWKRDFPFNRSKRSYFQGDLHHLPHLS